LVDGARRLDVAYAAAMQQHEIVFTLGRIDRLLALLRSLRPR
jgi:hypothetical protein